jgi:hypothetical protein
LLTSNPAMASYPTSPNIYYFGTDYCSGWENQACTMYPLSGWILYSSNGRDRLGFGGSGNFAGYINGTSTQWFSTNTAGQTPTLDFQSDCNVVMYTQTSPQRVLWASDSSVGQSVHKCRLTMGGDGHFSIWDYYPNTLGWVRIISWGNGA